jgi:hypothetical protein
VQVEAEYDNSADNPNNPSSPPKRVRWGEQTTDEMCLVGVQVTTDSFADLRTIAALNSARLGGALVGGLEESDLDRVAGASTKDQDNDRVTALIDAVVANGFDIPAGVRDQLKSFDQDGDGRISKTEFDAIPLVIQLVIREAIREKVNAAVGKGSR